MLLRRFVSVPAASCCLITRRWSSPNNSAHSNRCFPVVLTWVSAAPRAETQQQREPCAARWLLQGRIFPTFSTNCVVISASHNLRNESMPIPAKTLTCPFIFSAPATSARALPENSVYHLPSPLTFNQDRYCQPFGFTAPHFARHQFSIGRTPWLASRLSWPTPTNRPSFSPPLLYKCF